MEFLVQVNNRTDRYTNDPHISTIGILRTLAMKDVLKNASVLEAKQGARASDEMILEFLIRAQHDMHTIN